MSALRWGLWLVWGLALARVLGARLASGFLPDADWLRAAVASAALLPPLGWARLAAQPAAGLLAAGAVLLALAGAGAAPVRWIGVRARLAAPLAGFAVASAAALGLAASGLARIGVLAVAAGAAALAGAVWTARARKEAGDSVRRGPRLAAAAVLAALVLAAFAARLPLVHGDAHVYHLGIGEEIVKRGRWVANPWDPSWHVPLATEMLSLPAHALGGIEGAKAANLALLALLLAAGGALAERLRQGAGWSAAALLAGCGALADAQALGKNDLGAAVAVAGAAGLALRGGARPEQGRGAGSASAVLAAALCGLAVAAKLPAAFPAAALLAVLGGRARRRWILAPAFLAPLAPWLLQDWVLYGNPVSPFASRWLGGIGTSPQVETAIRGIQAVMLGEERGSARAILRHLLSFGDPAFGSVLLGAALPLALAARREGPGAKVLLAACLGSYAAFLAVLPRVRYLLPLLAPAAALAAAGLASRGPRVRSAAGGVALAAAFLAWTPLWRSTPAAWPAFLGGALGREEFRSLTDPAGCDLRAWANRRLRPREAVLIAYEQRRLGLRARTVSAAIPAEPPAWRLAHEVPSPERLRVAYRQLGVTHLAHNIVRARFAALSWYEGPAWSDRALAAYREMFLRWGVLVRVPPRSDFESGGFYVWKLEIRPHAPSPFLAALPGTEGLFRPLADRIAQGPSNAAAAGELLPLARRIAARVGPVLDAQDWTALILLALGRPGEALPFFERERRAGYANERSRAAHARALAALGRAAEARAVLDPP